MVIQLGMFSADIRMQVHSTYCVATQQHLFSRFYTCSSDIDLGVMYVSFFRFFSASLYIYVFLFFAVVYHDFRILQHLQLQCMFSILLFCFLFLRCIFFCSLLLYIMVLAFGRICVCRVCMCCGFLYFFLQCALLPGYGVDCMAFILDALLWCSPFQWVCLLVYQSVCMYQFIGQFYSKGWYFLETACGISYYSIIIILECFETLYATELMCTEVMYMQNQQNFNEHRKFNLLHYLNTNEMCGGESKFIIVPNIIDFAFISKNSYFLKLSNVA